jgi:hypothetical protein
VAKKRERATENRRGSPEAVQKRRVARAFNDLFDDGRRTSRLDGRTDKRRRRLLAELEAGKKRGSGKELKPLDVLSHVSELLKLGEPLARIRKACRPRLPPGGDAPLVEVVARLHRAYAFAPEAYHFVGLGEDVLRSAGVLDSAGEAGAPAGAARRRPGSKACKA